MNKGNGMDSKQDIVIRLRENADLDAMEHCNPIVIGMEREAADEIERLREVIASLQPAQEPVKPLPNRLEHELKVWPEFYSALLTGDKTFELRKDDRGFRAGDVLRLREWNPRSETYSGREQRRLVTYILSGQWGLEKDVVCMALSPLTQSALSTDAQKVRNEALDLPRFVNAVREFVLGQLHGNLASDCYDRVRAVDPAWLANMVLESQEQQLPTKPQVYISETELQAFNRFCECCEDTDADGYDVSQDMMKRLAEVGLVRSLGFKRYTTTRYGDAIRALQSPPAGKDAEDASLKMLLIAASHALRSYQCGNGSPDLAQSMADRIDAALAAIEGKEKP